MRFRAALAGMQLGMAGATPAQLQAAQNLAAAARMQSMAAGGVPPGPGGSPGMMMPGGGLAGMAGLRPPAGAMPFGMPGGPPPNGVLPPGAPGQGMRPPQPGQMMGAPPVQMMAGGMPPPQVCTPAFHWCMPLASCSGPTWAQPFLK
jgi:hypothetical protein